MRFSLRYDMRNPAFGAAADGLYRASIEQCRWADQLGFSTVYLAEHHAAEDGYCPAPMVQASAMMAVTERLRVHFSALLAPLHDPIRLAEDLAVLDLISRGRVEVTLGLGYRPHEFRLFGLEQRQRVARFEEAVRVLRAAWTGEPFEYRGEWVTILPKPFQDGGPPLFVGGSAEPSIERAARLGDGYMPAVPGLYRRYLARCAELDRPPGPMPAKAQPLFLHVSDDPERDWPIVAPHVLYTASSNAAWALERGVGATPYPAATTMEELQAHPGFLVLTPRQCLAYIDALPDDAEVQFQPLMGGLAVEIGWASLERFAAEVLPYLRRSAEPAGVRSA